MPDSSDKLANASERMGMGPNQHYYAELGRMVALMFVGVMVFMTFLLTVGFQRPHANFSYALYTTIIVLALNLIAYVCGHLFFMQYKALSAGTAADAVSDDKAGDSKSKSPATKLAAARSRLRVMRGIQQILFVAAVIAMAWLALATAHFFFTIPTAGGAAGAATGGQ